MIEGTKEMLCPGEKDSAKGFSFEIVEVKRIRIEIYDVRM